MNSSEVAPILLDVRVERAVAGGPMLAHHDGRVVLVTGAIPGERVRVRVDRARRDVIHATTVAVLDAHPDRRDPGPDQTCGGQTYRHIAYPRQCVLKADILRDALARIARVADAGSIPVAPSPERGHRLRARLRPGSHRVGFLRETSHDVCDPGVTGQLLPETDAVVAKLNQRLGTSAMRVVHHIDLAENLAATERVVHYQLRRAVPRAVVAAWTPPVGVSGVTMRIGAARRLRVVQGAPTVSDPIAALSGAPGLPGTLARRAPSFFQANRYLLPELVDTVCRRLQGPVLDLYAGVGLFSIVAAGLGHAPVTAVERDPDAVWDLRENASAATGAVGVEARTVEDYLAARCEAIDGTVIVDPPRAGLSRPVVERLGTLQASRLVYVSCDVATFARDVRRLGDAGFELTDLAALDLYPNTAHVEVVATLIR